LLQDIDAAISNKDEDALPDVVKVFVPLLCIDVEMEGCKKDFVIKTIF